MKKLFLTLLAVQAFYPTTHAATSQPPANVQKYAYIWNNAQDLENTLQLLNSQLKDLLTNYQSCTNHYQSLNTQLSAIQATIKSNYLTGSHTPLPALTTDQNGINATISSINTALTKKSNIIDTTNRLIAQLNQTISYANLPLLSTNITLLSQSAVSKLTKDLNNTGALYTAISNISDSDITSVTCKFSTVMATLTSQLKKFQSCHKNQCTQGLSDVINGLNKLSFNDLDFNLTDQGKNQFIASRKTLKGNILAVMFPNGQAPMNTYSDLFQGRFPRQQGDMRYNVGISGKPNATVQQGQDYLDNMLLTLCTAGLNTQLSTQQTQVANAAVQAYVNDTTNLGFDTIFKNEQQKYIQNLLSPIAQQINVLNKNADVLSTQLSDTTTLIQKVNNLDQAQCADYIKDYNTNYATWSQQYKTLYQQYQALLTPQGKYQQYCPSCTYTLQEVSCQCINYSRAIKESLLTGYRSIGQAIQSSWNSAPAARQYWFSQKSYTYTSQDPSPNRNQVTLKFNTQTGKLESINTTVGGR